jgi:hypothetical protein
MFFLHGVSAELARYNARFLDSLYRAVIKTMQHGGTDTKTDTNDTNKDLSDMEIGFIKMPQRSLKKDIIATLLLTVMPIILLFSFAPVVMYSSSSMVHEKEKRLKVTDELHLRD